MARSYRLLSGRNKLIPRIEVEGRHRKWGKSDPDNPFENGGVDVEYESFTATECTVQPMSGKALRDLNNKLTLAGEEDYDSFTVYSETPLFGANEGTKGLSDQLYLPTSRGTKEWFTVIKSDVYVSSGAPRYRHYLISVPVGTEGGI